jgi:hypothetical protein
MLEQMFANLAPLYGTAMRKQMILVFIGRKKTRVISGFQGEQLSVYTILLSVLPEKIKGFLPDRILRRLDIKLSHRKKKKEKTK